MPHPRPHQSLERLLLAFGITALAFNLRPAAVSIGPLLEEVRDGLGMSPTVTGFLTALPVLCFAVLGGLTPAAARRVGMHRLTLVALLLTVVGLGVRAVTGSALTFLVMSVLALAGAASANVLLPSMVKLHYRQHVGRMTAVYTTALAIGLTAASGITVPVAHALDSWRWGIGVWAFAGVLAVLPWLFLLRHDERPEERPTRIRYAEVARTDLGRAMALVFGLQSLQAYVVFGWLAQIYRDAGLSASEAGFLLAVVTATGIPLSFVIPSLASRYEDQTTLMLGVVACYPVGYLGLLVAPTTVPWLWALLIGVGTSIFPLVLTQMGLRSRTPEGTAALSGFSQSVGYVIAGLGPFGVGLVYDATGSWTVPLLALIAIALLLALFATRVSRPRMIEDELATHDH